MKKGAEIEAKKDALKVPGKNCHIAREENIVVGFFFGGGEGAWF
jgi:hypothetical protein